MTSSKNDARTQAVTLCTGGVGVAQGVVVVQAWVPCMAGIDSRIEMPLGAIFPAFLLAENE